MTALFYSELFQIICNLFSVKCTSFMFMIINYKYCDNVGFVTVEYPVGCFPKLVIRQYVLKH